MLILSPFLHLPRTVSPEPEGVVIFERTICPVLMLTVGKCSINRLLTTEVELEESLTTETLRHAMWKLTGQILSNWQRSNLLTWNNIVFILINWKWFIIGLWKNGRVKTWIIALLEWSHKPQSPHLIQTSLLLFFIAFSSQVSFWLLTTKLNSWNNGPLRKEGNALTQMAKNWEDKITITKKENSWLSWDSQQRLLMELKWSKLFLL